MANHQGPNQGPVLGPVAVRPFTSDQFLHLGLRLRSNGENRNWENLSHPSKVAHFRSSYTVHPTGIAYVWELLQTSPFVAERIDNDVEPRDLLIVYRFLSAYDSEKELYNTYGVAEKRIRVLCQRVTHKIALLRKTKIDPNWEDDDGLLLCTTVDGIHYPITEPRPFSTLYKSHKGGGAHLDYEFVVYTHKNKVASIIGPFPAATNDKTVFRTGGLWAMVQAKQMARANSFRIIADDGYIAERFYGQLVYRNELDPKEVAYFKDRALSRHETFNGLTKRYGCLTKKFHHDRSRGNQNHDHPRHKDCVEAICVTIQCEMDKGVTGLLDPYADTDG